MARFNGKVGFAVSTEVRPGVWQDVITERTYYGNVTQENTQADSSDKVNNDIRVNTVVEIVDAFASENAFTIRYVEWAGKKWEVTPIQVRHPRLLLTLGGVYNGATPSVS